MTQTNKSEVRWKRWRCVAKIKYFNIASKSFSVCNSHKLTSLEFSVDPVAKLLIWSIAWCLILTFRGREVFFSPQSSEFWNLLAPQVVETKVISRFRKTKIKCTSPLIEKRLSIGNNSLRALMQHLEDPMENKSQKMSIPKQHLLPLSEIDIVSYCLQEGVGVT